MGQDNFSTGVLQVDNFIVGIQLSSEVIIDRPGILFDCLLAHLIYQETGDLERAHSEIPLKYEHGVWWGSYSILEAPFSKSSRSIGRRLQAIHTITSENTISDDGRQVRVNDVKRISNILNEYESFHTPGIYFAATGDADKVHNLLMYPDGSPRIPGIGKLHTKGVGTVESITIEPEGHALAGLTTVSGDVLRPIPVKSAPDIKLNGIKGYARPLPPAWRGDAEMCYLPSETLLFGTPDRIMDMLVA